MIVASLGLSVEAITVPCDMLQQIERNNGDGEEVEEELRYNGDHPSSGECSASLHLIVARSSGHAGVDVVCFLCLKDLRRPPLRDE
nr:hypothetical protein CFP56_30754 [Quercus suber]POE72820.1 hypothetical protein CFP56_30759 [Quercus suber]